MTTRRSSTGLALLISFLFAMPPAAFADDTELFTTSATPNVLLMLDTTGSMDTTAGGSSVGDLDGEGNSNSRMDVLWKVVYTLLNADLSTPAGASASGTLRGARTTWGNWDTSGTVIYAGSTTYNRIRLGNFSSSEWDALPGSGTVVLGSGSVQETLVYTSKGYSSWGGYYYLNFNSRTFANNWSVGNQVAYSSSPNNFPTTHTEATSTAFLNNLTVDDENILKARIGLMTFTTNSSGTSVRINIRNQVASNAPNSPSFSPTYQNIWSSVTDYAYAEGGTPTAQALHEAQNFFGTAYNAADWCRPNFAVMITDGEDTMGGSPSGGSGTGGGPDYYSWLGTFYPDGNPFTFNNRGQVARNNAVIREAYNLKTHSPSAQLFTVGVGVSDNMPHLRVLREVLRRAAEQNDARADVGAPNPNTGEYYNIGTTGDNTAGGAGRAFFATDANELSTALRNVFHQISLGAYSFTAPTVPSIRTTDRNYLYKASFTPVSPPATFWEGRLEALTINPDGTLTSHWDAGNVLKSVDPSNRRIYSGALSGGAWERLDFGANPSGATSSNAVDNNMLDVSGGTGTGSIFDNVVKYVRGVGHDNNAKLGDIFHSKPVVVGPPSRFFFDQGYSTGEGGTSFAEAKATRKRVIYVGTNDGMLHAFLSGTHNPSTGLYDNGTGQELFGYVPNNLLGDLEDILPGDLTTHGYYVDSSPRVADVWIDTNSDGVKQSSEWRTVLIGGFRKGGNGYFALDVTDPPAGSDYANYPKVLWEYVDPTNVAQTWSEPFIGKVRVMSGSPATARDRWVAIFGGGKDSGTEGSSLVVLDIATGTALKTFTSGIDNSIAASPTAVLDAAGYIKFAYVADLDGSIYKFDFRTTGTGSPYSEWTMNKIFQASAGQPVYHRVEPGTTFPGENTRFLYFGTGNQENPVSDGGTGKFYAVKDTDSSTTLVTEGSLADLTNNLGTGTAAATQYGWFINLAGIPAAANTASADTFSHSGEKVLSDPVVFFNNVFFTTYTPDATDPCGGGGIARVYGINMLNASSGLAALAPLGETSTPKVSYHVYAGSEGGIPSSPSLSIYPSGQSSIFVGFSTGAVKEIGIESPPQMKTIKSWKETF
jgi:hypothetical protein